MFLALTPDEAKGLATVQGIQQPSASAHHTIQAIVSRNAGKADSVHKHLVDQVHCTNELLSFSFHKCALFELGA